MSDTNSSVPYGYCECGCGGKAPIAEWTHRRYGYVKGEPKRYIHGHAHANTRPKTSAEYGPMSEFDFGWLVGILEGEGCFTADTKTLKRTGMRRRRAYISVASTDKSTIDRLTALVPYCSVVYRRAGPSRKPHWVWSVSRGDVVTDLMIAIRPYMGARRQTRINELLATCNGLLEAA